jgi:transcriptional regulator with GAF, ATPase, and Fis domain
MTKARLYQLQSYDWPGNIRELQNVIERAVILSRGRRLQFELPQSNGARQPAVTSAIASAPAIRSSAEPDLAINEEQGDGLSLDELASRKRAIVEAALIRTKGKIYGTDGAAALLKMKPTTLASMVKRQNLARGVA